MKWNSSESLLRAQEVIMKNHYPSSILILLNQLGDWQWEVGRQREKTNV